MTISNLELSYASNRCVSTPVELSCRWGIAITGTGLLSADNSGSTITDPDAQITAASRCNFFRIGRSRRLIARMAYAGNTISASGKPVIQLFGRISTDIWQPLRNGAGAFEVQLEPNGTTDVKVSNTWHSTPRNSEDQWDLLGFDEFLFGVKTAAVGEVGQSITACRLEVRLTWR